MVSEPDRHDLYRGLEEQLGKRRAETFMNMVSSVPWSEVATKADLERFATKADLENFATKADLERFATKADLERFATKAGLENFATKADLERMGRKIIMWVFPTVLGTAALAFAAGRLV